MGASRVLIRQVNIDADQFTPLSSANITSTGRPIDALIMPATSNPAKERGVAYPYGYGNLSAYIRRTFVASANPVIGPMLDLVSLLCWTSRARGIAVFL